jgi:hypothetical protein
MRVGQEFTGACAGPAITDRHWKLKTTVCWILAFSAAGYALSRIIANDDLMAMSCVIIATWFFIPFARRVARTICFQR